MTEALRFAVLGSPVAHSKSPAMHTAAYRALGMPHVYEAIDTAPVDLASRVQALRDGAFAGLNVTVPHKERVLGLVDRVDASASGTGAANTLVRGPDGVCAYNTDAPALVEELTELVTARERFVGRSAVVLGTGGAARAAIFALGRLGVSRVIVRGRRTVRELAAVLAASGSDASLTIERIDAPPASETADLAILVQATTAGMIGADPGEHVSDAVAWETVPRDTVALDVVYAPPRTPFVARASARGLATANGLGLLARQGALAFALWLGVRPPLDVMRRALLVR